jgi:type III restriction enzyme
VKGSVSDNNFTAVKMMSYRKFLEMLSSAVALTIPSLHNAFSSLNGDLDINKHLSQSSIQKIRKGYNDFLMQKVFGVFNVGYLETSNKVHPTKFTNEKGEALPEIDSGGVGVHFEDGTAPQNYLFDEVFYDGQLELENIKTDMKEIIVYSKIPKNSIRIPLLGGGSYSPDFAYLINSSDGQSQLSLVVETKGKDEVNLAELEKKKIKHAEQYFNQGDALAKVRFETQLQGSEMMNIIEKALV